MLKPPPDLIARVKEFTSFHYIPSINSTLPMSPTKTCSRESSSGKVPEFSLPFQPKISALSKELAPPPVGPSSPVPPVSSGCASPNRLLFQKPTSHSAESSAKKLVSQVSLSLLAFKGAKKSSTSSNANLNSHSDVESDSVVKTVSSSPSFKTTDPAGVSSEEVDTAVACTELIRYQPTIPTWDCENPTELEILVPSCLLGSFVFLPLIQLTNSSPAALSTVEASLVSYTNWLSITSGTPAQHGAGPDNLVIPPVLGQTVYDQLPNSKNVFSDWREVNFKALIRLLTQMYLICFSLYTMMLLLSVKPQMPVESLYIYESGADGHESQMSRSFEGASQFGSEPSLPDNRVSLRESSTIQLSLANDLGQTACAVLSPQCENDPSYVDGKGSNQQLASSKETEGVLGLSPVAFRAVASYLHPQAYLSFITGVGRSFVQILLTALTALFH